MSPASTSKLFQPIQVGDLELQHRLVLAPWDAPHLRSDLHRREGGRLPECPGYHPMLISGFFQVTDAVHAKGSYIFCQLWALGRAAHPEHLAKFGLDLVSSGNLPMPGSPNVPRPLTVDEIREYVKLYAHAAKNAIEAGFDGVEVHNANGYLLDQFLQDVSNNRTDEYGGSIENRCRFSLEVIEAVVKAVGEKRTGARFGPWELYQGMGMANPRPTFTYIVRKIRDLYPDFAYLHVTEARSFIGPERTPKPGEDNDFLREIWAPRPMITAGGYTREMAIEVAERTDNLVAFGRMFISNPDLPLRIMNNIPLTPYNRDTFFSPGKVGYTDYPFAECTA